MDPIALPLGPDQTGLSKNVEMLGNCRLGDLKEVYQLVDAKSLSGQEEKYLKPGRV